ncbi:MAG: type IX secretion system membrane protein PorP/SprF, partial [Croceitalea sp.]|nr:type IX secretion system membrane protein PorP/SprF [Croceitalea sp.]
MIRTKYILLFILALATKVLFAQEETPYVTYEVPSQNLVKFNRFLINPTFSTVREDKSYVNLFHRNQSVSFDDNYQTYFLSYSGRIGDRSGVGVSLYSQRQGLIDNFGLLANYAYGIKLSDKSNFTFGANVSYYNSGFNNARATPAEQEDPLLASLDNSALISFQPGFNLSYGKFDFGMMANNLFDYNLKTSESVTEFNEKTFSGHLQYTHELTNGDGIFESARLMPLARARKVGEDDFILGGSLILDLPKLGWLQAGYDDFYGVSAGLGFNLTKRISLGYTLENGLSNNIQNFGNTHEISLAYSFTPNLTEDRVMLEKENEELAANEEIPVEEVSMTDKDLEIAELKKKLAANDAIVDEMLLRQDSIEKARDSDLERRFTTVMRMVQRETNGERPDLEEKARQLYFANMDSADVARLKKVAPLARQENTSNAGNNPLVTVKKKTLNTATKRDNVSPMGRDKLNTLAASPRKRSSGLRDFKIANVESGYYLVANVYKGPKYMNLFIDQLRAKGLNADYIENPTNGYKYVYLKKFGSKKEAFEAYKSKLNGAYQDDVWVMKVNSDQNSEAVAINTNSRYGDESLQKNVVANTGNKNKVSAKTLKINGVGQGYY